MKDEFKVKFNPLIPLLRLIWVVAAGALLARILYVGFSDLLSDTTRAIIILLIGTPVAGLFFYFPLKALLSNSKMYSFSNDTLTVTDLVWFRTERLNKEMIVGFSESEIPYRIGTFGQIIIYRADHRKFEIMQFECLNFKDIKQGLIDSGYVYFGYEPYHWKFFDSRSYEFESKDMNANER